MMIKRSVNQEDITILNIYAPNNRASKYIKQNRKECQGENYKLTNYSDGCRSQYSSLCNKSCKQKISKDIVDLGNTSNQLDLINWK